MRAVLALQLLHALAAVHVPAAQQHRLAEHRLADAAVEGVDVEVTAVAEVLQGLKGRGGRHRAQARRGRRRKRVVVQDGVRRRTGGLRGGGEVRSEREGGEQCLVHSKTAGESVMEVGKK